MKRKLHKKDAGGASRGRGIALRALAVVLTVAALASALVFGLSLVASAAETGNEIDVYLIAGQSNAEGYGEFNKSDFAYDSRFARGFSEVLYWGDHESGSQDTNGFVKVKLGLGQKTSKSGAEIGIASAVADTGRKSAVIKCAIGSTYLYPYTTADVSQKYGTWTSPLFVDNYLATDGYANITDSSGNKVTASKVTDGTCTVNSGNIIGGMYRLFIANVTEAVTELRAMGYTPVLRGMWWMQGEAETWISWGNGDTDVDDTYATDAYTKLLTCLISNVRSEMIAIFGSDQTNMPFVIGRIVRNSGWGYNASGEVKIDSTTGVATTTSYAYYIDAITAAQDAVANGSIANVGIVDPASYPNFGGAQHDGWHFSALLQKWLGEQFVATVNSFASDGSIVTEYGTVPAEYASKIFAVFSGGEFLGATDDWGLWEDSGNANSAINLAYKVLTSREGASAQILMLNDHSGAINTHDNFGFMAGELTVDLGGHSFDTTSGTFFFNAQTKNGARTGHLTVNVKNGAISSSTASGALIRFSAYGANAGYANNPRKFIFNFDNVRLSFNSAGLFKYMGSQREEHTTDYTIVGEDNEMRAEVTFNNCTFNMSNSAPSIFNASDPDTSTSGEVNSIINVKVNGGNINATQLSTVKASNIYSAASNGSSVKFGLSSADAGEYGGMLSVRVSGTSAPTVIVNSSGFMSDDTTPTISEYEAAKFTFGKTHDTGYYAKGYVYALMPPVPTKYGTVPAYYGMARYSYPLLVFAEGKCVLATASWAKDNDGNTALNRAVYAGNGVSATVLFRNNVAAVTNIYNNCSYAQGSVTVDLGGYTFAVGDTTPFNFVHKSEYDHSFTIKNGKINMTGSSAFMYFNNSSSHSPNSSSVYGYNVTLEGITVSVASTCTAGRIIASGNSSNTASTAGMKANNTLEVTDCSFNLSEKSGVTVFNINDTANMISTTVTLRGGKVTAPSADGVFTWAQANSSSCLKYLGNSKNVYVTLSQPSTVAAPAFMVNSSTGLVDNTNGDVVFLASGSEYVSSVSYKIYKLSPPVIIKTGFGGVRADYYNDTTSYPFLVYNADKQFELATATFTGNTSTVNGVASKDSGALARAGHLGTDCYIFMRRNAEAGDYYSNTAYIKGTVTVDLGGYTLSHSSAATKSMLTSEIKGKGSYDYNFVFQNGGIGIKDHAVICATAYGEEYSNSSVVKTMNYTFEKVKFSFVSGAKATSAIVEYSDCSKTYMPTSGKAMITDIVFNGCTFDMTNAPAGATLFDAADGSLDTDGSGTGVVNSVTRMTVNGGKIVSSTEGANAFTLVRENASLSATKTTTGESVSSVVIFGKYGGSYISAEYHSSIASPEWLVSKTTGRQIASATDYTDTLSFGKMSTSGTAVTYTLLPSVDVSYTQSTMLAKDYYAYNFHVIVGGEYVGGRDVYTASNDTSSTAFGLAFANTNKENLHNNVAVILMTKDYVSSGGIHDNFSYLRGEIIFDLGGHTFTHNTTSHFINAQAKMAAVDGGTDTCDPANGYYAPSTFKMRNGTFLTKGPVLRFNAYGDKYAATSLVKDFYFDFDNVHFAPAAGSANKNLIFAYHEDVTSDKIMNGKLMRATVTLTDCSFDMTDMPAGSVLFDANDPEWGESATVSSEVHIKVLGGEIITEGSLSDFVLAEENADLGSTVVFEKSEGEYPEYPIITAFFDNRAEYLFLTDGGFVSDALVDSEIGVISVSGERLSYVRDVSSGDMQSWVLREPTLTDYGYVLAYYYNDPERYPFLVFDGNGACVFASAEYGLDLNAYNSKLSALDYARVTGDGAVVLLNRDFIYNASKTYNNLNFLEGEITVDLGGYTFEVLGKATPINATQKSIKSTRVTVKGGTYLLSSAAAVVAFNSFAGTDNSYSYATSLENTGSFCVTFDGVTFKASAENTAEYILATATTDKDAPLSNSTVSFVGCTVDLSEYSGSAALLGLTDPVGRISLSASVTGGEIIANSQPTLASDLSKLIFEKSGSYKYTTLTMPSTAEAPTGVYSSTDGEAVFVKLSEDGEAGTVTYRLRAEVLVSFVPKTNITLMSELIYNVYVPAHAKLLSFTLDGVTYDRSLGDFDALTLVTIEDTEYYHLKVKLPAKRAARSIVLTALLDLQSSDVSGKWTVSIPKYARQVIASEESTEADRTLMYDVLAYIKSAYAYFGTSALDESGLSLLNTVLGDYERAFAAAEGEASASFPGVIGATFTLDGAPGMRFYIDDESYGYSLEATRFTFYQGTGEGRVNLAYTEGRDERGRYLDVSFFAYRMTDILNYEVRITEGEEIVTYTGAYHLNSYYAYVSGEGESCYAGEDKEALTTLVEKFYSYCISALEYRNAAVGG